MEKNAPLEGEFILSPSIKTEGISSLSENKVTLSKNHTQNPTSLFSSFITYPKGTSYVHQAEDEFTILLLRRKFITNIPWIAISIALLLFPFFFFPFISSVFPKLTLSGTTVTGVVVFYYIALFGYIILKYALWYFHVGLVTNKKIVDIDMASILSKHVSETTLDSVEDVTYIQKGVLRTFFNYGDVHIQTEAILPNFEFDSVPQPSVVSRIIGELAHEAKGVQP